MECGRIISLLSEYIDRELSEGMCTILEEHFDGCRRCTSILHTTRVTIRLAGTRRRHMPGEKMKNLRDLILFRLFHME
jgi:hypothetical protein